MSAFTPGPWRVYHAPASQNGDEGEPTLFAMEGGTDLIAEIEANAQLMESSPDMYEALKVIVGNTIDYATINNLGDPYKQHDVKLALAALAKAEGRTP